MDGSHFRKCWRCQNVEIHGDSITPYVNCKNCGSQDTRRFGVYPPPETSSGAGELTRIYNTHPISAMEEILRLADLGVDVLRIEVLREVVRGSRLAAYTLPARMGAD